VFAPQGEVEYWHGEPTAGGWSDSHGSWRTERPASEQRRVGGLVHEGSTLPIGAAGEGVVGLDYRPHQIANIHLTGAALWPTSGSWNPTLTMVALAQDLADQLLAATSGSSHSAVPPPARNN
jgi:choline dehydrogenase-like flavoprotein